MVDKQKSLYSWEKYQNKIPENAVYTSHYYVVARGKSGSDDWRIGKFNVADPACYVVISNAETKVETFELLVIDDSAVLEWVPARYGAYPVGGVGPIGDDAAFVGRVKSPPPEAIYAPGCIDPEKRGMVLGWNNTVYRFDDYEALVIRDPVNIEASKCLTPFNWHKWDGIIYSNAVYANDKVVVARGEFDGDFIIGQFHTDTYVCNVLHGGVEKQVPNDKIQLLVKGQNVTVGWELVDNGKLPKGAVGPLGKGKVYVGRVAYPTDKDKAIPGNIDTNRGIMTIAYDGSGAEVDKYEALVIRRADK